MRGAWIVLAVLATTLTGRASLAQEQAQTQEQAQVQVQVQAQTQAEKKPTVGGHIGFVLPLVTRSGGQTISDLTDQFSVGFPVGITVKGTGRMAFDLELVPTIHTKPRQTTLTRSSRSCVECGTRLRGGRTIGIRRKFPVVGIYAPGKPQLAHQA